MYDSIQTTTCSAQKAVHVTDAQQSVRLNGKGAESTDKQVKTSHTQVESSRAADIARRKKHDKMHKWMQDCRKKQQLDFSKSTHSLQKTKMQWNKDHTFNTARWGAHKKNMKRSRPMSLETFPSCMYHHAFMRNKPLKIPHTIRGHLKNVGHETSGLETIGRGCQGPQGRNKQKENKSLESLHSADLKKRSGRLLFWEEQANPRANEKSSSPRQPGTREQQQDRQAHQLPHAPRTSRPWESEQSFPQGTADPPSANGISTWIL